MKTNTISLTRAASAIAQARKDLWVVQLEQYPDSVAMTEREVFDFMQDVTESVAREIEYWDKKGTELYPDPVDRRIERMHVANLAIERERGRRARAVAFACVNDPIGVFYKCVLKPDGTYKFIGYRYGLEPSEYMSGFTF